jgi:hypothetical protein
MALVGFSGHSGFALADCMFGLDIGLICGFVNDLV